ncbi:putative succinyl-CoA:3-ketoacid-coenzyme Atransferase subunit B (Succinyl CoA:3-oxoacid CoA-transferase) (OXCTB) [Rickettsia prowazekii str. Rp22]|uniref:Succinyl-CoA:3-ketoacid-coenzyme Atransferase subunit B (Succinyl CoA:3-oxoacid CoA-transferase) (OXCTB) n=1 Tax=Rickettsia prowazekii (strain Rp22) TaxID=449216 RepID=D5AXJ2_RICPP|nr:putative succinyl-CoA:3-ketoacid-coenzyme Atransferase subunit B (Succinyl CoA:3-oxoacid CoA-transferase) (OXCTB) [Rickettsia prowazekii str. Rp22]AGJ01752.1 succinyl-CoA:3-ketoacid-coenzyme Atransferase subunit B (Succinyl CoA:3-oxoacid CoA-transferase) [Rickettsia prowazekii str. NMRC Madrid E]AGJ02247.1 succinyl-CoA:3-ketoacid-coenzyme Atransferase subunit B (Succinyl CoA:3-oxoacid CoA-transferase) [Rickettsia prowazekii str. Breinl]EOB09969.1 Type III restriction enzyme, res subunit [Rick
MPYARKEDNNLINDGKQTITAIPERSYFSNNFGYLEFYTLI